MAVTFTTFTPTFQLLAPDTLYVVPSTLGTAVKFIAVTLFGTLVVYEVLLDVNPGITLLSAEIDFRLASLAVGSVGSGVGFGVSSAFLLTVTV